MIFEGRLDPDRADRDFDFWFGYNSEALRRLCIAFNLETAGTKKERAARLYFAYAYGYDPKDAGAEKKIIDDEKKEKLIVHGAKIPNPELIADGSWKVGLPQNFPFFERQQIADYFSRNPFIAPSDMKELNKYTTADSYKLFRNGHVKTLRHYECGQPACLLISAKCKAEMQLYVDYDVWICIDCQTAEVSVAYCSCIAGLPGYCKHTFAVLFELENYSDNCAALDGLIIAHNLL